MQMQPKPQPELEPQDHLIEDTAYDVLKPKAKPEHALAAALGFDEDDLAANREGTLSPRQLAIFQRERLRSGALLLLVTVLALAVLLGVSTTQGFSPSLVALLAPLVLGLMVVGERFYRALRMTRERPAAAVTGRVKLDIVENGSRPGYRIRIGDKAFRPNKYRFLAFKNGDPYTIYYAPYTNRILSAEWLRDEDN